MGKSDPPPPPDPKETSAAQTGTNVATAIANSTMGMVDQYTPYGSLTYSKKSGSSPLAVETFTEAFDPVAAKYEPGSEGGTLISEAIPGGETTRYRVGDQTFDDRAAADEYAATTTGGDAYETFTDPYTGKTYRIPQYESRVELSPEQQTLLDANNATKQNLADLSVDRSDFLLGYLPQTEAITDQIDQKIYDMGARRLDPRFEQQKQGLETQLVNSGIRRGSEAWDRAMGNFGETQNDAYNQLTTQARGTALNEVNLPINQIIALMSGTQVQNPNVQMQSPASIPTTDNAGIINSNYQQQLQNWQTESQQKSALMGGLFGAAGTALGAPSGSVLGGWLS